MTTLSILIPILLVAASGLSVLAFNIITERNRQLEEFRAKLKPGQMVRLRRPDGTTIRARIVSRNNQVYFSARCIDSQKQYLTSAKCIYQL